MRILVTGPNGFVGRALCSEALARRAAVRGITRAPCDLPIGVDNVVVGSIDGSTDWLDVLADCEVVVHLAARVHVMQEATADPLEEFRRVNGEATQLGRPFTADDAPAPLDAYGVSRWRPSRACARLPCKPAWKALLLKRGFMQRIARGEHVTAED